LSRLCRRKKIYHGVRPSAFPLAKAARISDKLISLCALIGNLAAGFKACP
jgi:hypothetical protein